MIIKHKQKYLMSTGVLSVVLAVGLAGCTTSTGVENVGIHSLNVLEKLTPKKREFLQTAEIDGKPYRAVKYHSKGTVFQTPEQFKASKQHGNSRTHHGWLQDKKTGGLYQVISNDGKHWTFTIAGGGRRDLDKKAGMKKKKPVSTITPHTTEMMFNVFDSDRGGSGGGD